MIKAIVFDFGNVILSFDYRIFYNKISVDQLKHKKNFSKILEEYETGKINTDEFYNKCKKLLELDISQQEFENAFTSIFTHKHPIPELVKKLKPNYKIGLISDINPLHLDNNLKKAINMDLFDSQSLSFEIGIKKPDKRIYEDCLSKLGVKAEECIYIDDIKWNAEGASKLGFYGIQYENYDQLIKELKKLKIKF